MSLSDNERDAARSRAGQLSNTDELGDYQVGDPRIFIEKDIILEIIEWQKEREKGPEKDTLCRDLAVHFTVNRIARSAKAFLKQNNSSKVAERAHLYWELRFTMAHVESKQSVSNRMPDLLKRNKPSAFSWLSKGHFWLVRVNADGSPRSKHTVAIRGPEQNSGRRSKRSSLSSGRPSKTSFSPFPPGVPTIKDGKVEVYYDEMFYRERWSFEGDSIQQIPKDPRDKSKADESVVYWSRYSVRWLVPSKSRGHFGKELEAIHFDRKEAGYEESKNPIKRYGYSEASVAVVWSRE